MIIVINNPSIKNEKLNKIILFYREIDSHKK